VLLSRRVRDWGILLVGIAGANLAANAVFRDSLWLTLSFIPGNVVEIVLSAYLIRRFCVMADCISRVGTLLTALVLGGIGPTLVGALLGAATLASYRLAPFSKVWFSWFAGSALGSVSILPLGLFLVSRGWRSLAATLGRPAVVAVLVVAIAVSLWAPTSLPFPYVYVSVALVLVATVGHFAGAALAVLACSLIIGTLIATGNFQLQPGTGVFREALFYLPLLLTLLPPMLLAATLERVTHQVEQIAERETYFRSLYEKTPAMMHSTDKLGNLIGVSEIWLNRLGYEKHEVLGRKFAEFLSPTSKRHAAQVIDPRIRLDDQVKDAEHQLVAKTGELVDVLLSAISEIDAQGQTLRTLTVLTDVTEQKRLAAKLAAEQEALHKSEERLRHITDNVPALIAFVDKEERYRFVNRTYEEWYGKSLQDIVGRSILQVRGEAAYEGIRHQVDLALSGQRVTFERDLSPFGVPRIIQTTFVPQRGPDGDVLGYYVLGIDITERKRAQLALEASLQEKTVLLSEVHHRVKNNLQIISSLLNLQSARVSDGPVRSALAESQNRVATMALMHQLLYERQDFSQIDLGQYLQRLTQLILNTFRLDPSRISLRQQLAAVPLDFDRAIPCGLLFNELVTNTLKHAFPGARSGAIDIKLERVVETSGEAQIVLSVGDDGVGLPDGAFDWRQATTLGLQLVQALAQQAGGTLVRVEGTGTCFQLRLPLVRKDGAWKPQPEA
jgi:PAS domain S-box-containing protein